MHVVFFICVQYEVSVALNFPGDITGAVHVWLMDRPLNQSQDNAGTEPFHAGAGGGCAAGGADFQPAVL